VAGLLLAEAVVIVIVLLQVLQVLEEVPGGVGPPSYPPTDAATANTGGGSGGGSEGGGQSGTGGSGAVVFRILTVDYSGTVSGNETPIVDGAYTIIPFHGNGSYTAN